MRQRHALLTLLLILMLAISVSGCKKKDTETLPTDAAQEQEAHTPPPAPEPDRKEVEDPGFDGEAFQREELDQPTDLDAAEYNRRGVLRTIFFAYDSSELSQLARQTLRANAEWLKAHEEFNLVVEGHCDERGTIEYNLELGQRRASSVRDYLVTLGVDRPRIRAVTYGEERPEDPGHDEAAWSRNRRAEFVLE